MALQYFNLAMNGAGAPMIGGSPYGSGFGFDAYGRNNYLQYLGNMNQATAGAAGSIGAALQNRLASDYGNYIQGWNNIRNNITAGNIAQLQDTGQTTRTGMQTASSERIAGGDYDTRKYEADRRLSGIQHQANQNLAGVRYQTDAERAIADLTTARGLEGTKYASDQQTEQARIGITPQMEALAFSREKWGDLFPWLTSTIGGLLPGVGGGGGTPVAGPAVPGIGNVDTDALVNNANRAAYQAFGEGVESDVSGLGGRGFTTAGSGSTLRALENQRRMGLANQLADNAVQIPIQTAQALGPLQLQAAGLRETGRAARAQEAIQKQRMGQDFITAMLGIAGGLA